MTWWVCLVFLLLLTSVSSQPSLKNILFIFGESLRPDLLTPSYNGPRDAAPNLQALQTRSRGTITVDQAHASYPLCNPSRTSLLFGRDPDRTNVKTNLVTWQQNSPAFKENWVALPKLFSEAGWISSGGGKIFHRETAKSKTFSRIFDGVDKLKKNQCVMDKKSKAVVISKGVVLPPNVGCITTSMDISDLVLANNAVKEIQALAKTKRSFFMVVGFQIPHFPIRVNAKFWNPEAFSDGDMFLESEPARNGSQFKNDYSFEAAKNMRSDNPSNEDAIPASMKNGGPFDTAPGTGPSREFRMAIRALYLAGIRQVDNGVGRILKALVTHEVDKNTIIVVSSDHSLADGETRVWEKDMPLDISTRVPLIFHIPWATFDSYHTGHDYFFNLLDLYRTFAGFAGISKFVQSSVQGRDWSAALMDAAQITYKRNSTSHLSQVVRCSDPLACFADKMNSYGVVGKTLRTKGYRYVVYMKAYHGQIPNWERSNIVSEELYDHSRDLETIYRSPRAVINSPLHEFVNIADANPKVCVAMFEQVRDQSLAMAQ